METLNIHDPSAFMHVGDDYMTDVMGANAAGWKSVLITNDYPYTITSSFPTIQVNSLQELYLCFQKLLE